MQETSKKEMYSLAKYVLFTLIITFIFRQFLFVPTLVKGESMLPTFENNNGIIISKTTDIQRFDLIVFNAPDEDKTYIKRVIGLPGDYVVMQDDVLYINGQAYQETYLNRMIDGRIVNKVNYDFSLEEITGKAYVPEGYLFVLGDNRLRSKDSREFGFISEDSIVGEVKARFYPLNEMAILK